MTSAVPETLSPPPPRPRILVVSGSRHLETNLSDLVRIALDAARSAGAEAELLNLHKLDLPVMEYADPAQKDLPAVKRVRETAAWAEGFILATPEYHGNMSGCLKNWFDFLYKELAGKLAGVLACTGGGGGDMSITSVKNSFQWCHGFTLPYHAAARASDFEDGRLANKSVAERVQRIAHDIARYTPVIRAAFEQARALGEGVESGFAGS